MRVLALTHVFPRSSEDPSAPFLLTWARALRQREVGVTVIAPHDAGLPREQMIDDIRIRLARYAPDRAERMAYRGEMHQLIRTPSGPPLVASLIGSLQAAVRKELRTGQHDVLHVHWWVPGAIAARLARPKVPVVVTVHGTDVALIEGRPDLAKVARWGLAAADRIEAVSTDLADRLEAATGIKADAVNPMPLAPHWFSGPLPNPGPLKDRPRILAVGRLVPEKGFADLIDAVAILDQPVTLEIIGEGPLRDLLAGLARNLSVPLEMSGRMAPLELRAAYARADLVVQPSLREGLGLVAAEALLSGTPVIATDSGGVRDILPINRLIPPNDVPRLALRIMHALQDLHREAAAVPGLAERLRERLTPAASAARTIDGYRTLLSAEAAALGQDHGVEGGGGFDG